MKNTFNTTTTSYPLNEVLGLIEQAVALMGHKKYQQACLSLTQALQINRATLLSEMAELQQKDEARLCEDDSSSWLSYQLLNFVVTRSNNNNNNNSTVSIEDRFNESSAMLFDDNNMENLDRNMYVHSAPLIVLASDQKSKLFRMTTSQDVQTVLSLIIIFNLAMANHLDAIDQTRKGCSFAKSRALLSRALALYGHAKDLQCQLKLESCWFFSLTIVNNEAQILAKIGEHKKAEELLQGILSSLCCLNQHYREENESLPPIASLEGFSHNTSYLILKDVNSAAAA